MVGMFGHNKGPGLPPKKVDSTIMMDNPNEAKTFTPEEIETWKRVAEKIKNTPVTIMDNPDSVAQLTEENEQLKRDVEDEVAQNMQLRADLDTTSVALADLHKLHAQITKLCTELLDGIKAGKL